MRPRSYTDEEAAWMRHEYEDESSPSARDLAERHQRTFGTVLNMLRYAGASIRPPGFYGSYGSGGGKDDAKPPTQSVYDHLSRLERDVLWGLSCGYNNAGIAAEVRGTNAEVRKMLLALIKKFGRVDSRCVNRQALVSVAQSLRGCMEAGRAKKATHRR